MATIAKKGWFKKEAKKRPRRKTGGKLDSFVGLKRTACPSWEKKKRACSGGGSRGNFLGKVQGPEGRKRVMADRKKKSVRKKKS